METLKYKGFIGSIEIQHEDNTLYGKILGLEKGTLITYEGNTIRELKEDFMNAVEDYIAHCKEHNLPLYKSYSGSFNVWLSPELHTKVIEKATNIGMSLNSFIRETLQKAVL
ncbi:type II toxin-antitoxin system HicB family antitoxin [Riemerella columbipharyngis]|uniref:Predicted nuclease of the RNAse H fold, HicB family n=1 Tax=Riemerella columbipharyngis TaxID=1071918 RepID=A0A1G7AK53_9FLAO|nr:type II toxin-antitoxin system HicB family antitoxin [Riemerella columbipharyngis]SDE15304.1 Predicted nuclease of the RNAse H fold, HicB family [Riemerella columbipharyngis]